MFWRRRKAQPARRGDEPLFAAVPHDDAEMNRAHQLAASTMPVFLEHVLRSGERMCCAKLRFRDPELSDQLGEDRFLFLWLSSVVYHENEGVLSGTFFEVPRELTKWHQIGQRLAFAPEDVFDWMVNENGHLQGGYTMRVTRSRLSEGDQAEYDRYTGVKRWEPLPD